MDEYVDLNMYDMAHDDGKLDGAENFSHRIMKSRPATAYKKERNFDLPFPELFDRSERTYAASFAKYGDLSYYTPIQRIGSYMDYSARLKRKHLIDLIAYIKTSKKPIKPADEEVNEPE
jgi:predicted PolB exonuclease-like 3'-5' exonuclease